MKTGNKEKELDKLKSNITEFRRGNVVIKRGQTLFIAEVTSNPEIKLDLGNIYNSADRYVQKIVIPSKKELKNILLWRPSDISKIETLASKGGDWILLMKSATNVLRGDNYVFVSPDLLENKLIVKKGDVITSSILGESDLNLKSIDLKLNHCLEKQGMKLSQKDHKLVKLIQMEIL